MTDGESNEGPDPESVYPNIKQKGVGVYMVAFDVNNSVFDAIKKQGAGVVSASNETQLDAELTTILKKKVLLEDAE